MMSRIRVIILTSGLFLFLLSSKAQVIQEVQNSFNLYRQTALQEKIFVHTDKDTYLPGEILWFKIYCVDGNDHKPINLSKVAYIDLLDIDQNPVIQAKVELKNGLGDGSVYIPISVGNGYYHFRCYTRLMKNFSPEFYFEKDITLINPLKSPETPVKTVIPAYDVRFFPEGGDLVSDLTSKLAFKAVDQNGRGVNLTGVIINQHNDTAVRFRSLKFGMGSFDFTPVADNTYKAVIKIGNNKPIIKELPDIRKQGTVMRLTEKGTGSLNLSINSTNIADGNIYLFVHTRQQVGTAESIAVNNGMASFIIDKSKLGSGISHITIFNANKQPVCERLYCKKPLHQLSIDASTGQQQYGLRKKININVSAKDKNGQPLNADMSIAVYRVDSLQSIDHTDIFDYLWLTSELKGNVESAEYYFKDTGVETDQALDNLMLTQGWRRFKWNDLLENATPHFKFLPEYYGHIITAKIINTVTNAPAKGIITYLGIPGKRVQLYPAKSDSAGDLLYNTKNFYGANEIIIQTNPLADSIYRVDVNTPFSDQFNKSNLPRYKFNAAMLPICNCIALGHRY